MRNRLMSALTESDYCAVLARMRPISVDTGTRLLRREQLGFCLFIETGFAGVCYSPDKGQPVSVGVIGEDGMLGISAVLGVDSIDYSAVALTPCHAFAIRPSDLRPLLSERPSLQLVLLGYAHRRLTEMMRMAACYARHSLEQRLAGCLLRLADLGRNLSVPLTHQQLGLLLSVTRPSVTLAMRQLEDEGAVTCRRNLIEIRDREALSRLTCGCQLLSNSNGKISVHVHSTLNRPSAAARPVAPPTSQADGVASTLVPTVAERSAVMRKKAASDTMTAPELAARIRAAAASAGDILRPPDHRRIGSLAVGEKQRAARAEHRER